MFCNSCGAEVAAGASFCNKCGQQVTAGPGGTAAAAAPAPAPAQAGLSENAASAIAYLTFIPAVLFLVIEPYNHMRTVKFHAWQCIALSALSVLCRIAFVALAAVMHWGIWFVYPIISLAFFAAWLIAIIKASQGQMFKLPFIGDWAEQQANK